MGSKDPDQEGIQGHEERDEKQNEEDEGRDEVADEDEDEKIISPASYVGHVVGESIISH